MALGELTSVNLNPIGDEGDADMTDPAGFATEAANTALSWGLFAAIASIGIATVTPVVLSGASELPFVQTGDAEQDDDNLPIV